MSAQHGFVPVHGAGCVCGLTFSQAGCAVMDVCRLIFFHTGCAVKKVWDMERECREVRSEGGRGKVNTLV